MDGIVRIAAIIAIAVVFIVKLILDHRAAHSPKCKHEWSKWGEPHTNRSAMFNFYFQRRTCSKCGETEERQL